VPLAGSASVAPALRATRRSFVQASCTAACRGGAWNAVCRGSRASGAFGNVAGRGSVDDGARRGPVAQQQGDREGTMKRNILKITAAVALLAVPAMAPAQSGEASGWQGLAIRNDGGFGITSARNAATPEAARAELLRDCAR